MSDDEEVVLTSSELHKYLERSEIDGLISSNEHEKDGFESSQLQLAANNYRDSPVSKILEIPSFNSCFKKPELCSHTSSLIETILKTGLMYPDHVADIEVYLKFKNLKPVAFFSQVHSVVCGALLIGSASSVALFYTRVKPLHYVTIFAGSLYCGCKIYDELNKRERKSYERKKVKLFADVLERLFSITRKALSFIFESEFVLKTKLMKDQPFYVAGKGWISSNSAEGLKNCGLLLTEFRAILGEVYYDVTVLFDYLTSITKTYICLQPHIDCDSNYSEMPDGNTLRGMSVNPSLENLKKLNNIYLIAQSEFLRRLALSFVKDFWVKGYSQNDLNILIRNIVNVTNLFLNQISILETFYERCIKINENKSLQMERKKLLNARNANGKLFIFARNFLTKAEAHVLSLSLDLKMIDEWINECDEKNEENCGETLRDRLVLMKSNIETFSNLCSDNLNNLNVINSRPNSSSLDVDCNTKQEDESIKSIEKIALEVGKSDFEISGEDEVLVSLCSENVANNSEHLDEDYDYEDREIQKCLPKNVLMELKCALKYKKEEWIVREKKAIKSDDIDQLDFDTLTNTAVGNDENCKSSSYHKKKTYRYDDSESDSNRDVSDPILRFNENLSHPAFYDSFVNNVTSKSPNPTSNSKENEFNLGSHNRMPNNSLDSSAVNSHHSSFVDQIKSAQKSFSLSLKEEEFIDSYSDDSDENEDK